MKKNYSLSITLMLVLMLVSFVVYAQPVEMTILFVGQYPEGSTDPREEDQVAIDSISNWISNVEFAHSSDFNDATATELYDDAFIGAKGVIISESIGGGSVGNFGLRDNYPVPCIMMEAAQFTGKPAEEADDWPLLYEDGGTWGYADPLAVDVQWRIWDDMHYITTGYGIGDIINYAPEADRGVPYLHGFAVDYIMLATAARTDGGDAEGYVQDEAAAMAYLLNPEILFVNVAYTYLAVATEDFWNIMHRAVKYMFDAYPVAADQVLTEEFNLSVFPNPASKSASVRFSMEAGKNVLMKLYSVTGGLVGNLYEGISSDGENVIPIHTDNYASGLYMVEMQVGKKISYTKFVLK